MQIQELLSDDDAVSPVIGVILMVAITVILAAVIASFVLGLGDQAQQTTPTASISFDYTDTSSGEGDGDLRITHDGGDAISASELYVRGSGIEGEPGDYGGTHAWGSSNGPGSWADQTDGSSYDTNSEVRAGNYVVIGASDNYDIRVVYEASEGDSSATLGQDSGPEA